MASKNLDTGLSKSDKKRLAKIQEYVATWKKQGKYRRYDVVLLKIIKDARFKSGEHLSFYEFGKPRELKGNRKDFRTCFQILCEFCILKKDNKGKYYINRDEIIPITTDYGFLFLFFRQENNFGRFLNELKEFYNISI